MAYKKSIRPYKEVLGFKDGPITIFAGDTYAELDWFRASEARYNRLWGWHFVSDAVIPEDLPETVKPIKLEWDTVAINENSLKEEDEIKKIVESLIYDPGTSEWVGKVGDKIDEILTVVRAVQFDGSYGRSTAHTFKDAIGNLYTWMTSAKCLEEGMTYRVKGGIKSLDTYHNQKTTVLTRCRCTEMEA